MNSKLQSRARWGSHRTGILLIVCAVALFSGMNLHADDASWPLSRLIGPNAQPGSAMDTEFLKLINRGKEDWQSLFVNRIVEPMPNDILAPYRDRETTNGPGGMGTGFNVPVGTWAYAPDFDVTISWYFNSFEIFGSHHPCMFEIGGCGHKYISHKADDLDLYNRCTLDPFAEVAKYNFDDKNPLYHSRNAYDKASEAEENGVERSARESLNGNRSAADKAWQGVKKNQQELERIARSQQKMRSKVANAILAEFERNPPRDSDDICSSLNKLLSVGLLDSHAFLAADVQSKVMNLMYRHGMIFEFSQQLAFVARALEKTRGANAVRRDPTIRQLRHMQLELYADYSFRRLGPTNTQTPVGMFNQLDISSDYPERTMYQPVPASVNREYYLLRALPIPEPKRTPHAVTRTGTLDGELLFLLQAYHQDYPYDQTSFHLGNPSNPQDGQYVTQTELASMLVSKISSRSADRHKTDQARWDKNHPQCKGISGFDARVACESKYFK